MILLIPEANALNYPLCLLLSLGNTVRVYRMHPYLNMLKGRIEILNLSDYFDWAQCAAIGSKAVDIWESMLPGFPASGWEAKINAHVVDLSLKARQELQHEVEKLVFLKSIVDFHRARNEDALIVNSLKFDFLSRSSSGHDLFRFPASRAISCIFVFLDRLGMAAENLLRSCAVVYRFVSAFFGNKSQKRTVRYLYAGIAPSEMSDDKNKITFSWLVDGVKIRKDEIIFLLPGQDMLKLASRKHIIGCFPAILWLLIKCAVPLKWGLQRLLAAKYAIRIMQWVPVIESLRPKIYIDSVSSAGFEDPGALYFRQAKGIKTIMWSYGINSYPSSSDRKSAGLRRMLLSHIISSDFIVWNEHYREFVEGHAQNGLRTHVLGPLMCGDESVMRADRSALFEKAAKAYSGAFKYVAVFDSPPVSRQGMGFLALRHGINSEEYNNRFMEDMFSLLSDFKEIALIYKPKWGLENKVFSYSAELRSLVGQMSKNERTIILAHDVNPWLAVAMADICVSLPFISSSVAAIHYEKAGLFHDPANIVLGHRYIGFEAIITHSYEELKFKISQCLRENARITDIIEENRLRKIQGRFAKENSSSRFREYLLNECGM